jgi:hypothetical protein
VEAFAGKVTIGCNRLLAAIRIDDLDRDDWRGAIIVGVFSPMETELRPGLTVVQIAEPDHLRSGHVALAVVEVRPERPEVLVLSGETAFRCQPCRLG